MAGNSRNSFSEDERRRAAARARLNKRLGISDEASGSSSAADLSGSRARRAGESGGNASRATSQSRKATAPKVQHATRSASDRNTVSNVNGFTGSAAGKAGSVATYIVGNVASHAQSAVKRVPPLVLICAGVVLALFILIAIVSNSCAASAPAGDSASVSTQGDAEVEQPQQAEQADFSLLPDGLDAQVIEGLQAKAEDDRVVRIVNHGEGLASLGTARQAKLLKLAANDDAALDYVADFGDKYPAAAGQPYTDAVEKGTIPDLKQWDERWGYVEYCAGPMGLNGCCPTSFSMVYMGLTGKTDKTPADLAALATQDGYAIDNEGTVGDFLIYESPDLGLSCQWFYPSSSSLTWYLENGFVCIVNVGEGDFTDSGHFFVAYALDEQGNVLIRDPYSSVNTAKAWDPDVIANQSISMYAFAEL